jgi:segregation and condensation protein A
MPDYRVELDLFSGPLDLLLYLVRRNEIDAAYLPIAVIADQFQEYLAVLEFLDLDIVGDFLVMASTLMEIKSREVLPQAVEESEEPSQEAENAHGELITRLLEYKKYKDAASALEHRAAEWQERYPRLHDDRPVSDRDHAADPIREVELWDLVSALSRVLQKKDVEQSSSIRYDDTPISTYVEQIGENVRREQRVAFTDLFAGTNLRSKIIGLFLAVLELLRHHGFRAEQPVDFGEIYILPPVNDSTSAAGSDGTF